MCDKSFKCHFCTECVGRGCISELPGMGGIRNNINFQLNCSDWDIYPRGEYDAEKLENQALPEIRLAPITGGVENIGYFDEKQLYFDMIDAAVRAGINISIGDGCPDEKILGGIAAVKRQQEKNSDIKAAVFIKPYQNERIFERIEWSRDIASMVGVDIDSYNIVTMRNLVKLEKKNASQLLEIKKSLKVPFIVKGVFTHEDIELVKQVKPDVIAISNHGGRVENRTGSTVDFLAEHGKELKSCCGEIWIDGGIRKTRDLKVASYFGAKEVMIARPLISALCKDKENGMRDFISSIRK